MKVRTKTIIFGAIEYDDKQLFPVFYPVSQYL